MLNLIRAIANVSECHKTRFRFVSPFADLVSTSTCEPLNAFAKFHSRELDILDLTKSMSGIMENHSYLYLFMFKKIGTILPI